MDQDKIKKITNKLKSIFFGSAIPVVKELPYIVIFICMMDSISHSFSEILFNGSKNAYYAKITNISILFFYAYIGACITTFIQSKVWKYISKISIYLIAIFLFFTTHFLFENFKLRISPTCLILLAETNHTESSEFINQYIFSDTIIPTVTQTSIFILIAVISELLWNLVVLKYLKFNRIFKTIISSIVAIAVLFSTSLFIISTWEVMNADSADHIAHMEPPSDPISSIFTSTVTIYKMETDMSNAISLNQSVAYSNNTYIESNDSLNVVVVIGESFIKHYSNLYGYPLKTNPYLAQEEKNNSLFVFNDVISSSNQTSIVIRNLLCCNNTSDDEPWHEHPYFPSIFKSAGYNVYYWSNQLNYSNMETFTFTLNSFLYDPQMCDISYTQINKKSFRYDEDLVNSFSDTINFRANKNNLILFHLNGQHVNVRYRFPYDQYKHYTADSIKRDEPFLGPNEKAYIADYNNATLYNDYVLHKIIDLFKDSNTILLYLSDHGDVVYSYMKQCGRDHGPLTANKLKYQYEIPFMIWCSDIYKEKYPEQVANIKNAVNRPFLSDNICNMLFNVANIETPYYRDSLDLISPNYKSKKRVINHKYVYEDIRYTIK